MNLIYSLFHGFLYNSINNMSYLIYNYNNNNISLISFNQDKLTYSYINNNIYYYDKYCIQVNNLDKNNNFNIYNKKIIIFIRHGESIANIEQRNNISIYNQTRNPKLSSLGIEQSKNLTNKLNNINYFLKNNFNNFIELAIISPLLRTYLTSFYALNNTIPLIGSFLCTEKVNTNSDIGDLNYEDNLNKNLFDKNDYNFWSNKLWRNWNGKHLRSLKYDLEERVILFNDYIKSRNEKVIVVFTHFEFMKEFFNKIVKIKIDNIKNTDIYPILV
jgi:broad specificity phosphatase PhoE